MKKQICKYRGSKKDITICISTLVAMYLVIAVFFMNHFYWGSEINGINMSCKTIKQANEEILSAISSYTLELEGREGVKEQIKGTDIGLLYDQAEKVKSFKESQNPLTWISSVLKKGYSKMDILVTFDEKLLKEQLNKLFIITSKDIVQPKDASFKYTEQGYEIVEESNGNKVNKDILYKSIENSILEGKKVLNLEEMNCYEFPRYRSNSKEVIEAKNILDKYTGLKITYNFGDRNEIVDGFIISQWVNIDKSMKVEVDEKKIRKYVASLAMKYNTFGNRRNFLASSGKVIQVNGGNYGWIINKNKEVKDLIENIKNGSDIIKQPAYSQTAFVRENNDIGNTYIEINLSRQHLWFYKNGTLIASGDIVTGNPATNHGTPAGIYRLNYKERKATLKGADYSAPVDFWMPFNGSIGLHDATWRSEFGGSIYLENGSHGCINAPYWLAKKIFDNIQSGTPVICYKE